MSSPSRSSNLKKREQELKDILKKTSSQRSQADSKRGTTAPTRCKSIVACEQTSTIGLGEADETPSGKHIPYLDGTNLHIHPSPRIKPFRAASTPAQQDTPRPTAGRDNSGPTQQPISSTYSFFPHGLPPYTNLYATHTQPKPYEAASMPRESANTGDNIDLIDDALKRLEEESTRLEYAGEGEGTNSDVYSNDSGRLDSTMYNSDANMVTSTPPNPATFPSCHGNRVDAADLDLMQCTPSPNSTIPNPVGFNCAQSSSLPSTRNPDLPNYSNSTPAHPVDSDYTIPSIASSEGRQDTSMSLQNSHLSHPATPYSSDLRKTALTNSRQHYALSSIVTRNRQGHLVTIDLAPALNASYDIAEDLHDWLELTGWHDVSGRTREIDRYRKLEALEKQQATIESERAALVRSCHEGNHGPSRQSESPNTSRPIMSNTYSSFSPRGRHDIFQDATMTGFGQDIGTRTNNYAYSKGIKREGGSVTSSKLARDFRRRSSVTRHGRDRSASPHVFQKNGQCSYRGRDFSRLRAEDHNTPIHSPSDALSRRPPESRNTRSETRDNKRRPEERREYREYLVYTAPKRDYERERRNVGYPKHINIGQRGDTRFFVMKSYNLTNIYDCQDQGLWATQTQNEATLRAAFEETRNVILFFSANKSHAFMGYARMTCLPSTDCSRPWWWPAINWKITEPFKVEWISKMHCEDVHLKYIRNPLNENLPITRCRDGQEIGDHAGREMISILNSLAVREVNRKSSR